jgi:hypothetical protein
MRKVFLLACIAFLPCAALAQMDKTSWASLNGLQPGQNITVVDSSSKKHSGTLISVTDTAIAFRTNSGEQSIERTEVRNVKLLKKSRSRNTLIGGAVGGAIGAGTGAAIAAATYQACPSTSSFCLDPISKGQGVGLGALGGFLGGAAVGGIVGAVAPSHTTVFNAKAK